VLSGKGELQTYWLHTKKCQSAMDEESSHHSMNLDDWLGMDLPTELFDSQRSKMGLENNEIRQCLSEQNQRLADWNSNQLVQLLNQVVARRKATVGDNGTLEREAGDEHEETLLGNAHIGVGESGSIVGETTDRIVMPDFDSTAFIQSVQTPDKISDVVRQQLHDYVAIICSMYVDNPFHSYQHASHVTMSIIKLLSCLAVPRDGNFKINDSPNKEDGERLHAKTYGISSDPIAHFALAFAALIHDVGTSLDRVQSFMLLYFV
jgi:hypothetical protein